MNNCNRFWFKFTLLTCSKLVIELPTRLKTEPFFSIKKKKGVSAARAAGTERKMGRKTAIFFWCRARARQHFKNFLSK